jgi:hypothetical protein
VTHRATIKPGWRVTAATSFLAGSALSLVVFYSVFPTRTRNSATAAGSPRGERQAQRRGDWHAQW